ncbi:HNH endonuclease [Nocardiopsis dassonvillei]|uniref:HNH endonuclease n=1 Tax=Nocardiopsis dassonvillei TaxID=2014 RepID=UPI0033C654D2
MSKDYVPTGVEKALFLLSRGHCYEPSCQIPVLQVIKGDPFVNVQIAHICAEEKNGPRYDMSMTREERRSFANLMLLCKPHHTMIDRMATVENYPVSLLRAWKKAREGDFSSRLNGIGVLNEEKLQELMADAVVEARQDIEKATGVLTSVSKETADMVKSLALEAFDRPYFPALDHDAVASLEISARMLASLPDYVPMLADAAENLGDFERSSSDLLSAVSGIDWPALRGTPEAVQDLNMAVGRLPQASSGLEEYVARIERTAVELDGSVPPVIHIDDQKRWQYLKVGMVIGAVTVIIIAVVIIRLVNGVNSG